MEAAKAPEHSDGPRELPVAIASGEPLSRAQRLLAAPLALACRGLGVLEAPLSKLRGAGPEALRRGRARSASRPSATCSGTCPAATATGRRRSASGELKLGEEATVAGRGAQRPSAADPPAAPDDPRGKVADDTRRRRPRSGSTGPGSPSG